MRRSNSIGRLDGFATSMPAPVSDMFRTMQPIPPSNSIVAALSTVFRLLRRFSSTRVANFVVIRRVPQDRLHISRRIAGYYRGICVGRTASTDSSGKLIRKTTRSPNQRFDGDHLRRVRHQRSYRQSVCGTTSRDNVDSIKIWGQSLGAPYAGVRFGRTWARSMM